MCTGQVKNRLRCMDICDMRTQQVLAVVHGARMIPGSHGHGTVLTSWKLQKNLQLTMMNMGMRGLCTPTSPGNRAATAFLLAGLRLILQGRSWCSEVDCVSSSLLPTHSAGLRSSHPSREVSPMWFLWAILVLAPSSQARMQRCGGYRIQLLQAALNLVAVSSNAHSIDTPFYQQCVTFSSSSRMESQQQISLVVLSSSEHLVVSEVQFTGHLQPQKQMGEGTNPHSLA